LLGDAAALARASLEAPVDVPIIQMTGPLFTPAQWIVTTATSNLSDL
jgi:hypothetical protein